MRSSINFSIFRGQGDPRSKHSLLQSRAFVYHSE
jgi:hypothetical protein